MMDSWIQFFLDAKRAERRSPGTITTYTRRLNRFATWLDGRPISRATIRGYSGYLATEPLAAATHASYITDVIVFVHFLMDEEIMPYFKTTKLKPRVPSRLPAHYKIPQVKALLAVADARERAVIVMFLDTGIRVGELIQLRRTSFDADGHTTIIGKGDKERSIWISPAAQLVLDQYLATRTDTHPALFYSTQSAQGLTGNAVHQLIARVAKRAGIRGDVRRLCHSFRATFARTLLGSGSISIETLRVLLGHEDIAMSLHYAKLATDEVAEHKRRANPLGIILGPTPFG